MASASQGPTKEDLAANLTEHLEECEQVVRKFGTSFSFANPKNSGGLTDAEAARRLQVFGKNILTPPYQKPEWLRFLEKFKDRFILLLMGAGTLSIALAKEDIMNLYLGVILYVVCIVACTLSYKEEGKVASLMDTFRKMLPKKCMVIRAGRTIEISAEELVVGDVIFLKGGDQVPADVRLMTNNNVRVECSSLTGESDAIPLVVEACEDKATPINEATNVAFSSSLVIEGEALGIVVRTSDQTLLGRIASVAMGVEKGKTTLEVEIDRLVSFISVLAIAMAIIVFVASVAQGEDPAFAFVNGFVVIIIANVPQGLQLTVMVALNVSGRRLAKKNIYVKSLNTIETLGSASCICTDKTGTLTQNVMTACHLWVGEQTLTAPMLVEGAASATHFDRNPHLKGLVDMAGVCNKAAYNDSEFSLYKGGPLFLKQKLSFKTLPMENPTADDLVVTVPGGRISSSAKVTAGRRPSGLMGGRSPSISRIDYVGGSPVEEKTEENVEVTGDASDVGLMKFSDKVFPVSATRAKYDVIYEVPFNSSNKYSACIIRPKPESPDQRRILWIKGAPEIVLAMCTTYVVGGSTKPIDENFMTMYNQSYESFASQGERVLGFAEMYLDAEAFPPDHDPKYKSGTPEFPALSGLSFVGLVSLVDPPRVGVKEAVAACRTAGIKVIMVTGDHPLTGGAIARKVGIIRDFYTKEEIAAARGIKAEHVPIDEVGAIVVHGHKLFDLDDEAWNEILDHREIVFARTTPEQKLQIVKHCQRLGEVVAVTGDGVNDAPALRQADIGIAMGTVGSDVSRDAANVVLVTNDWSTIVQGVEEGRVIFDNLIKSVAYTLTHLWPEVFPSILALVFGFPFLITSILVLSIDLGTDMIPAISLAYESAEPRLMNRPPRDMLRDRLITKNLLTYAYLIAGLIQLGVALLSAFLVFWSYGISLSTLPFTDYFASDSDNLITADGTVYNADKQVEILNQAHAAYFIGLVGSQTTHIWVCRTRFVNMWQSCSSNIVIIYGVMVEVLIMVCIVYLPFSQPFFATANPPSYIWATPFIFAGFIWPFVEGRKWWATRHPEGKIAKLFAW